MTGEGEFFCWVDYFVPRPPAPPTPREKQRGRGWGPLFVGLMIIDGLGLILDLLVEGLKRLAVAIWRPVRGQVWSGGWESEAGRFVVAVRESSRRAVLIPGVGGVRWRRPDQVVSDAVPLACSVRRRRGRRVEIGFGDGSWVTVWMRSLPAAERYHSQSVSFAG